MGNWVKVKISDIGEVVGGATPSTKNEQYYNGDISWITPKDLSDFKGRFISRGERNITQQGLESCSTRLLPKNTILFSSRAPIGYVAIAEKIMCTNQGFKSVIPNENVDYMFLYYLLKYNKDRIEAMGSGTTFKEVSGSTMRNIEVVIPNSISEQKKIANILDAIDSKIENNQEINNNLEQQIMLLYDDIFESALLEVVPITDIIDVRDGTHDSPKPQSEGFPLVTSKHLLSYGVDKVSPNLISSQDYDKVNERSKVDTYDILMSMIGTIGITSLVIEKDIQFAIKNVALFKTSQSKDLVYYVLCYLKSIKTQQNIEISLAGSTQKYISLSELRKLPIKKPSNELLSKFNEVAEPIIERIINNTNENQYLTHIRDVLLTKLMSGEMDLSGVDV